MKEGCHPQQMLGESGIAAAISTFPPLSHGDRRGADLGGPEFLHAVLGDTAAVQNRRGHNKLSLLPEKKLLESSEHCLSLLNVRHTHARLMPGAHEHDSRLAPGHCQGRFFPLLPGTVQLTDRMENNRG